MAKTKIIFSLIISVCCFGIFSFACLPVGTVFAASGTISDTDRYAYSENSGWVDFGSTEGDVTVADAGLTGDAWLQNGGWMKLDADGVAGATNTTSTNWGVVNDGAGNLSGYAYAENIGWINFDPVADATHYQVKIAPDTGIFSGYAWGQNVGWISFSGSGYGVVTTWRQQFTLTYTAGSNGTIDGTSPQTVNYGSEGTLVTATPATGYHFVKWSDNDSTVATRTDTNITANISATASFAVNPSTGGGGSYYNYSNYTINASAGTNGSINPNGLASINYGGSQIYIITPSTGYQIADVLVDGVSKGPITTYTFSGVNTNHTISATFSALAIVNGPVLTQAEIVNYVSGVLKGLNTFFLQNLTSLKTSSNKNEIIQVIQQLLSALGNLLKMAPA